MPHKPDQELIVSQEAEEAFAARIGPTDPGAAALSARLLEIKQLQLHGDPAFQPGSRFLATKTGKFVESVLSKITTFIDPTAGDVDRRTLTFAQTEAGQRLAAQLEFETERFRGRERLKLEETIQALAVELLPPDDVETAMRQVRRGEVVKSKIAFQAVLENLTDEARNVERRKDLDLAEENERRTLRQARANITIDMLGKNVGLAILFAITGAEGGE